MGKKVIGAFDLGASGGRLFAGFFEGAGFSMEEIYRFEYKPVNIYQQDFSDGGMLQKTYWNDLEIYMNIIQSLKQASLKGIKEFNALGIDTWGADGMIFNKYGEPLDRLYNYRDHRLDGIKTALFKLISEKELFNLTGTPNFQFSKLNQLFWLRENRPEYLDSAKFFLPVSSLFYYYLGGYRFAEYTWASTNQLLDPVRRCLNQELFKRLRIPVSIMPEIVFPAKKLGPVFPEILEECSLDGCDLYSTASHDTASAYYAAPVPDEKNSLVISSGTWSLIGKIVPGPIINDYAFQKKFSNEGGVGNIRFLKNVMGTWLIQELKQNWEEEDAREIPWEEIVSLADSGKKFSAFIDPDHESFFNPRNMEYAVKEFCSKTGQPVPETRGDILRACYESLAMKCRMVNRETEEVTGIKNKSIHVVGGGSKNKLLNSFIAGASGLPVYAGPVEATAAGNILVQASALGLLPEGGAGDIVKKSFEIEEFLPENTRSWENQYKRFSTASEKAGR